MKVISVWTERRKKQRDPGGGVISVYQAGKTHLKGDLEGKGELCVWKNIPDDTRDGLGRLLSGL